MKIKDNINEKLINIEDELNKPLNQKEIENFKKEVKKKFNYIIEDEFIEFLNVTNGFEYDGFIVYGIDPEFMKVPEENYSIGFVDNNMVWHENEEQKRYIFFGDSSISWYAYDREEKVYVELDKPSGNFICSFDGFGEMLEGILKNC